MALVKAASERCNKLSRGFGVDASGKRYSYKDKEAHFVGNLDEECSIACADGAVSIVGAAGKVAIVAPCILLSFFSQHRSGI
jgi:hypothetical protein